LVPEVYYLPGRTSQFYPADLGLSATGKLTTHDPPVPFVHMPTEEAAWVRQERLAMQTRRRKNQRGRGGGGRGSGRGGHDQRLSRSQQVPDTPEVIAAKRAARAVKRLATEAAAAACGCGFGRVRGRMVVDRQAGLHRGPSFNIVHILVPAPIYMLGLGMASNQRLFWALSSSLLETRERYDAYS
jgi:hypothetical protein